MATKIDYEAVLADLEDRRALLDAAIAAIRSLERIPAADKPKLGRPPKAVKGPRRGDLDYDDSANTSGADK